MPLASLPGGLRTPQGAAWCARQSDSLRRVIDRTAASPATYRVRERDPAEIDLVVLHQTGTGSLSDAAALRVKAHALVLDSGEALRLHPWLGRMRYGSGPIGNRRGVNVEVRANLPGRYAGGEPIWWRPSDAGLARMRTTRGAWEALLERWDPDRHRARVLTARDLLATLRRDLPALRFVCPHRTLQAGKGGCPGPDLWREVGEWAIRELGLELLPAVSGGAEPPASWRATPTIS